MTLVNPGRRTVSERLELTLRQHKLVGALSQVTLNGRPLSTSTGGHGTDLTVELRPGPTKLEISVDTGGLRCQSTPLNGLPSISATFVPHS